METPVQEDCDRYLGGNLRAIVEGIARSERFSDFSLEVTQASAKGDNYLGLILRVRISGRRDGKDLDSMSVIVKREQENEEQRAVVMVFFSNEAFMYGEVLPAFQKLQKEVGVLEDEAFSGTARWFASDESDSTVRLVLEDMSARGYRLGDRLEGLDPAHCRLVLRQLGRFHALSFAMSDQRPLELQRLRSGIKETIFCIDSEGAIAHFHKMINNVSSILPNKFAAESKYVKRFQEFSANYVERMIDLVNGEAAEPYAVICHGDCWTNNYLFKYSEVRLIHGLPYDLQRSQFVAKQLLCNNIVII
ncbi:hypothetical protein PR048_016210 [Dryococelus australis]|uniref:CHK kinase-like domain-containing protein n=1 Tax=Dryococelus australis TaxID=614101 RepID=A0ABQ9HJ33_9NEOP|nr:hypothetical protein PR048_016210 [Dryococelus australis]